MTYQLIKKNRTNHKWKLNNSTALTARANFSELNVKFYKNYLTRYRIQFFQNPKQFHSLINMKRWSPVFPSTPSFDNADISVDK